MRLNREKITCCVTLLIFLAGMYGVVLGFVQPPQVVKLPNIKLATVEREVFKPGPREHVGGEETGRNPFSFSEGWKDLDAVPLQPPGIPNRSRILPVLSGGVAPTDGGVYFSEDRPKEVDAASAGTTGTTSGDESTSGVVPLPPGGVLPVEGATGTGGDER